MDITTTFHSMAWTLILPLLGALLLGATGRHFSRGVVATVASGTVGASFLVVLANIAAFLRGDGQPISVNFWDWGSGNWGLGDLTVGFGFYIDAVSLTLMAVVTGVGFLIHWFSAEYMEHEPDFSRYFTLLNVFIAAMTLLVLANNVALLTIGWGGVGVASFALIGFWREKPSAAAAAKKAFVLNVIGDVGLMVAVFVLVTNGQPLDFQALFSQGFGTLAPVTADASSAAAPAWVNWVLIGLLVAAYAKSAQLPLHTWLPEAMEGPTPVSALIHAATMVTAGVYLLVRFSPLLAYSQGMATLIAVLGLLSALAAACWALVQTDLKRILAYSTMSQLGYMFMAVGVGAYGAAMFHLVTHAFFKALLFLTAGIVIHAAHGEQDMRRLGGLGRQMPYTALLFAIGGAALAGVPLTSGYLSKEAILHAAHGSQSVGGYANLLFFGGALVALMTAFYTGRAFFLTFFGPSRIEKPHLPGAPTTLSCTVLAVLALLGGYLYPELAGFLGTSAQSAQAVSQFGIEPGATSAAALGLGILATLTLLGSHAVFGKGGKDPLGDDRWASFRDGAPFNTHIYPAIARGVEILGRFFANAFDVLFQRGIPEFTGRAIASLSHAMRELQSGQVRHYMTSLMVSTAILLIYSIVVLGMGAQQ